MQCIAERIAAQQQTAVRRILLCGLHEDILVRARRVHIRKRGLIHLRFLFLCAFRVQHLVKIAAVAPLGRIFLIRKFRMRQTERAHQVIVRKRGAAIRPVRVGLVVQHVRVCAEHGEQVGIVHALLLEIRQHALVAAVRVLGQVARRHVLRVKRAFIRRNREQKARAAAFAVVLHGFYRLRQLLRLTLGQRCVILIIIERFRVVQPAVRTVNDVLSRRGAQQPGLQGGVRGDKLLPEAEMVGNVIRQVAEKLRVPAGLCVPQARLGREMLIACRLLLGQHEHTRRRNQAQRQKRRCKPFIFHISPQNRK